jgi:acyl dehydratase
VTLDLTRVGVPLPAAEHRWDETTSIIYALGVGAGIDELRYTTENSEGIDLVAIPSMAVILRGRLLSVLDTLGDIDPASALHADEHVILHRPLRTRGMVRTVTTVRAIHDKDPHALVVVETAARDTTDDRAVFTTTSSVMVRGAGGFGGDRGPAAREALPDREPDAVVVHTTSRDQALVYRLSGDRNPLHSDPERAARAGFERPILHGLCSLGFACRALIDTVAAGDPHVVEAIGARFSSPVYPGDTLRTEIYRQPGAGIASFRVRAGDDTGTRVVLDRGLLALRA